MDSKKYDAQIEAARLELEKTAAKIAAAQAELVQLEHEKARLMNRNAATEYRARTRRLIQRGAIVENFLINPDTLTNDEIQNILTRYLPRSAESQTAQAVCKSEPTGDARPPQARTTPL